MRCDDLAQEDAENDVVWDIELADRERRELEEMPALDVFVPDDIEDEQGVAA